MVDRFSPSIDWLTFQDPGNRGIDAEGELPVRAGFAPFLITRGRFAVAYALEEYTLPGIIAPGSHSFIVTARVPRGTLAGEYPLRILESSQIAITDPIVALSYLFRSGPPPAPPAIECGRDETDDELACGSSGCR